MRPQQCTSRVTALWPQKTLAVCARSVPVHSGFQKLNWFITDPDTSCNASHLTTLIGSTHLCRAHNSGCIVIRRGSRSDTQQNLSFYTLDVPSPGARVKYVSLLEIRGAVSNSSLPR